MIVIGVTGGVGTGKSTVAGILKQCGAAVVDADVLAHQAMEPKRLVWREIVRAFGREVLNQDETVNRKRLAAVVFRDPIRRMQLEQIVHPRVLRDMKRQLHRLRRSRRLKAVVLDVPLLLEVGAEQLVDALIVVTVSPDVQRARLRRKHGWTEEETQERIDAQWDLSAKVALADHVVDNSEGVDATRTQVRRIWKQLVPASSSPSSTSRR